jgi:hypothetical protein
MSQENLDNNPPTGTPMSSDLEYVVLRRTEYPNILDFIDAYYWTQRGDSSKMAAYLNKIDQVKQKFPKE